MRLGVRLRMQGSENQECAVRQASEQTAHTPSFDPAFMLSHLNPSAIMTCLAHISILFFSHQAFETRSAFLGTYTKLTWLRELLRERWSRCGRASPSSNRLCQVPRGYPVHSLARETLPPTPTPHPMGTSWCPHSQAMWVLAPCPSGALAPQGGAVRGYLLFVSTVYS